MECDLFFLYNAVISIALLISLILMKKMFIWLTKRFHGRHSVQKSKKPYEEKEDTVVIARGKHGSNVIQSQIETRDERVVSVCNKQGRINRQGRKNGVKGTLFIMNSKQVRDSTLKKDIVHQQEKYAPLWKRNPSPVRRCFGATPEQRDNVAHQKKRDCVIKIPPVSGGDRRNDNCGMTENGSFSLKVSCPLSKAENDNRKRKGVTGGLEICRAPLDKLITGRPFQPEKVVQSTKSVKYPVRLWSVDSNKSEKTATAAHRDEQGSSENTTRQNEKTAISSITENADNDEKEVLDFQGDSKVQHFPRIVAALANMMVTIVMAVCFPLWDSPSVKKEASDLGLHPQGKRSRGTVEALAKAMMCMVMFVVWPFWEFVKKDWELFNEIYGGKPRNAYSTDHEVIARVKGQDMVNCDFYDNCLYCLATRKEGDQPESMEIIETNNDLTLLSCMTNVIATVKSKAAAVSSHVQFKLCQVTSRYLFHASTPEEQRTAEAPTVNDAVLNKTEANQSCLRQPTPLSTQGVKSRSKKSSRHKFPSQTLCPQKGKKGQFNEPSMVSCAHSPGCFAKQTQNLVKETHTPPLSGRKVVKTTVGKANKEKQRASLLSPSVKLGSNPKALDQTTESHSAGVSKLITSLKVSEAPEQSSLQSSENTRSTQVSDDIEKTVGCRGRRLYEKQELTESSERKNATEVNWQETQPKRSHDERITSHFASNSVDSTITELPKGNIKRKNCENAVDHKSNYELGLVDQVSRSSWSGDKGKLEQLESMEVEEYFQGSVTKQSEGVIGGGLSGMAVGSGSYHVRQALATEQGEVMDTNEQLEKQEEVQGERAQKSQQRQSLWSFFPVSMPSFMKSPFTAQAKLEEMEVVQEQESLVQQKDEEMAVDEKPLLIKNSCAQSEEDMDIDSHCHAMAAPLVKPLGMDAKCLQATSALWVPPESMKVSHQVFNPSSPLANPFTKLMDTKRPFAPTSGMLEDADMSVHMTSDEKFMMQGSTEQEISPDVASVKGASFTQQSVKPMMPKLSPALEMNRQMVQPVMHSVTQVGTQQSMQKGSNGDLQPAMPQIVAVPGSATQPHLLPSSHSVVDPNDQIIMEQLQLVPAIADPTSDYVDVSDSEEDGDSDDEVELDLETIERLSHLETSPDHATVIVKLLAEKELQEAMQLRTQSDPDSDSDCRDKREVAELLGSEAMDKLSELKACMKMYHEYSEKLAVLLSEEESSGLL